MKYYCNLLMSDNLISKKEEVLRTIDLRKPSFNRYLIVLPDKEDENLEIYPSTVLIQSAWKEKEWFIIGVADGYQDALRMVTKLTQLAYDNTEDVNIRNYILEKQRQVEKGDSLE